MRRSAPRVQGLERVVLDGEIDEAVRHGRRRGAWIVRRDLPDQPAGLRVEGVEGPLRVCRVAAPARLDVEDPVADGG